MSTVHERLAAAGFELPAPPQALGAYVPSVRGGALVFTSGQLPLVDGALVTSGMVGAEVDLETAVLCARVCGLNALAAASTVCDLEEVIGVAKVTGYVASAGGFTAQPSVIDGASEVLLAAFGDAGRHAREAVGVAALPKGAPVEVSMILICRQS
ncbi:MAG: RidA family protein [Coriobacteriia bacterium]|jgi:enamine deaminase RidA (YjgF/YER057c/UK114 family)|nr:RidA family protein [Coriobacteriia bacterium]